VHRFYQMWQQLNCSLEHASWENPSGCNGKLFSWVEVTVGAGTNGVAQPANFSTEYSASAKTTGEGSTALGFYNIQRGDAPYFTFLADNYAMSDNFHQSVNGGTGANHIMLGHADAIWFSVENPNDPANNLPATPPENMSYATSPAGYGGVVNEIENPNPAPGTNNWYTEDGYGTDDNEGFPKADWVTPLQNGGPVIYGGGSYTNCADSTQPGVKPIREYLEKLQIEPRCEPGHYYLLNNYNPGYFGNGNNAYVDHNPSNTPFTIPPSTVPSIGDSLIAAKISWKYYGDQWNAYVPDPYDLNYGVPGPGFGWRRWSPSMPRRNARRHRPLAQDPVQPLELCVAQPHHHGQRVFLQALDAARTRNRHDVRCAVEQPGERDLRRRIAFLACDLGDDSPPAADCWRSSRSRIVDCLRRKSPASKSSACLNAPVRKPRPSGL
jgi:phospholipase C